MNTLESAAKAIINELDQSEGLTYGKLKLSLCGIEENYNFEKMFGELLQDQSIRVIRRSNIGIPIYHLA